MICLRMHVNCFVGESTQTALQCKYTVGSTIVVECIIHFIIIINVCVRAREACVRRMCVFISVYLFMCVCLLVYICLFVCACACVCVCVCVCACVCVGVY